MRICTLSKDEYVGSKSLWAECFPEDGKEFIDWYYSKRSHPENVVGAFIGDRLVSMMHIIPMDMRLPEGDSTVGFVAGVCTAPDLRGRGICSTVFRFAFDRMRALGLKTSVLQPFDTAFYERFGYRTHIMRKLVTMSAKQLGSFNRMTDNTIRRPTATEMVRQYAEFMDGYAGYSLRRADYFNDMIEEYACSDARLVCRSFGYCAGYADGDAFSATEIIVLPRQSISVIESIAMLLPLGFNSYTLPVPLDFELPNGLQTEVERFSMMASLDGKMGEIDTSHMYGFDRY